MSSIEPFKSEAELLAFAGKFLARRVEVFNKDIDVCLTPDRDNRHAYFPALNHCVAFMEFLASLNAGDFDKNGFNKIKCYANLYMDKKNYKINSLALLYFGIRHKVTHQSSPNFVINTSRPPPLNKAFAGARFAWTVSEEDFDAPLRIVEVPGRKLKRDSPPWDVPYGYRFYVSIARLRADIVKSVFSRKRYLGALSKNGELQCKLARAMGDLFLPL